MIAFLATRLRDAQTDVKQGYSLASVSGTDCGEVIYDGETRPFRIITHDDQLHGLRLHAFIVLPHAEGDILGNECDVDDAVTAVAGAADKWFSFANVDMERPSVQ